MRSDRPDASLPVELHLDVHGRDVPVRVRRRATVPSPHTGRALAEIHGWVTTADPEVHRWLSMALRSLGERSVSATDRAREFAGKWLVSWNAYGESGGVHTYTLILREVEELLLEALLIGDVELHPYEYREQVAGDGLLIWAKLVGSEKDVLRLRRLIRSRGSFPVVRQGIHDEPREMRLGVAEWSEYEDRIKYRLVLVDDHLDADVRSELLRVEEENNRAALGFYANLVERMAELLVEKGVLSAEEVGALREAARAEPGVARHEFWRVADIDAL